MVESTLSPIPDGVIILDEERDALAVECAYTRKGAIPSTNVTRQQLIEDVLARGYTKRATTERGGRILSIKLENPETGQFYRFNRKGEVSYANRRWEQIMATMGQAQQDRSVAPVVSVNEGWRVGEQVTQEIRWGGDRGTNHLVKGTVYINSAQRWRVRITDPNGAPGLRVGNSFPATAAWQRRVPMIQAQPAPTAVPTAGDPEQPALGSPVILNPPSGGTVRGIVVSGLRADGSEELRVRIVNVQGPAIRAFLRGVTVPYAPEWARVSEEALPEIVPPVGVGQPVGQPVAGAPADDATSVLRAELRELVMANISDATVQQISTRADALRSDLEAQARKAFGHYLFTAAGSAKLSPPVVQFFNSTKPEQFASELLADLQAQRARRDLETTGATQAAGASLRIVPTDDSPEPAQPEQPHFTVEVTANGQRSQLSERGMTMAQAVSTAVEASLKPEQHPPAPARPARGPDQAPRLSPRDEFLDRYHDQKPIAWLVLRTRDKELNEAIEIGAVPYELVARMIKDATAATLITEGWGRYLATQTEIVGARVDPNVPSFHNWALGIGDYVRPAAAGVTEFTDDERFRLLATIQRAGGLVHVSKTGKIRIVGTHAEAIELYEKAGLPKMLSGEQGQGAQQVQQSPEEPPRAPQSIEERHETADTVEPRRRDEAYLAHRPQLTAWLDANFGPNAISLRHKADLARYIEGDLDTLGAIATPSWLPGLRKLNALTDDGLEDLGRIREQYQAFAAEEATKCPPDTTLANFLRNGYRYQNGVLPGAKKLAQFKEVLHARRVPELYAQKDLGDDAVAGIKFFNPSGSETWYVTEWDGEGLVRNYCTGTFEEEFGYLSLEELANVRGRFGIGIEIDMHFLPTPIREIKREIQEARERREQERESRYQAELAELERSAEASRGDTLTPDEIQREISENFQPLTAASQAQASAPEAVVPSPAQDQVQRAEAPATTQQESAPANVLDEAADVSKDYYMGVRVDKPAKDLTDIEAAMIFAPAAASWEARNRDFAVLSKDPRFTSMVLHQGQPVHTFDGWAAIKFVRSGELSEYGQAIERVATAIHASNDRIQLAVARKNAEHVLRAVREGSYNDILHPANRVSRGVFEEMTGIKLPKTVKGTVEAVGALPDHIRVSQPNVPPRSNSPVSNQDLEEAMKRADATMRDMITAASRERAAAAIAAGESPAQPGAFAPGDEVSDHTVSPAERGIITQVEQDGTFFWRKDSDPEEYTGVYSGNELRTFSIRRKQEQVLASPVAPEVPPAISESAAVTRPAGAPRSFQVEVTDNGRDYSTNGLRFVTNEQAQAYGRDLFSRWTALRDFRVTPSDDAPNQGLELAAAPAPAAVAAAVEVDTLNVAVSVADAVQTGATPVQEAPRAVEPLTIVDRHTPAGAVPMVVVASDADQVRAIPEQAYRAGDAPQAETIPASEATIPSSAEKLARPEGDCMAAIIAAARMARDEAGDEDAETAALAELEAAASTGRLADVKRLLDDAGITLLLGSQTEVFRLEVDAIVARKESEKRPEERNWYFARGDVVAPRSNEARTRANIEAIRVLKRLENEDRLATPEEKETLARFSGWGSMKGIFDDAMAGRFEQLTKAYERNPRQYIYGKGYVSVTLEEYCEGEAYNEGVLKWNKRWGDARRDLQSLLTEEEFMRAGLSALNAHYTTENVCHHLWDMAKQLGFQGGTVLEPAIGSGRIISAMPPELRDKCRVIGVEKDKFSAKLAQQLLPEARVYDDGFEAAPIRNGSADMVITNVPFSDKTIGDSGLNLHNFFILKSMEKLKPGGLAVLITTAHTLDSSAAQRERFVGQLEFVGALRLPNDAFASAGTDVTTDVLMLRKPAQHLGIVGETFTSVLPVTIAEDQRPEKASDAPAGDDDVQPSHALVNEYFVRHPENVLGVHSLKGSMYGRSTAQYTVETPASETRSLEERLGQAIATIVAVPNSSQSRQLSMTDDELEQSRLAALREEKVGSVVVRENKLYRVDDTRNLVPWQAPETDKDDKARARSQRMTEGFITLRDKFVALIGADLNPGTTFEESEATRKELRRAYEDFTEEFGNLNEPRVRKSLKAAVGSDPDFYTVLGLEMVKAERRDKRRVLVCEPAKILRERTLFPDTAPQKADDANEAALLSLAERGRIDLAYMARLLGREGEEGIAATKEEVLRERIAFTDPITGALEHKEIYLSGDVLSKLEAARKASMDDPEYLHNVEALEKIQPNRIPFEEIRPTVASAWLPSETLSRFVRSEFQMIDSSALRYDPTDGWRPAGIDGARSWDPVFYEAVELQQKYGTSQMEYLEVLRHALRGKTPPVYKTVIVGEDEKRVFDEVATREVEQRVDLIRERFIEWLSEPGRENERDQVEQKYNATFNRVVLTRWDGAKLRFPGLAKGSFEPMKHQRDAVMRILLMQRGAIAHGVGFGKSLEIILSAMEARRLGLATKPMVVCDNANYEQMVATVRQCYPHARILHVEEGDMSPEKREEMKARIAAGDHDLTIMSRSQFGLIRVSPEREMAFLVDDLSRLADLVGDDESNRAARRQLKAKEKAIERAETRLAKLRAKGGSGLTFEQLGVDMLFIDESHRHKKVGINTRFDGIKGIDTAMSQRGIDLLLKARYIQERRGQGRGAVGFTGTPCSNTMAEYWTGAKIFDPESIKAFGVETFDEFVTAFCSTENNLEMNEANGRWRVVERLKKFINGREFIRFINAAYDVRMDPSELGLPRPELEAGDVELASCPLSYLAHMGKERIASIYSEWETMEPKQRAQLSWVPLVLMQINIALSIDPRLVDPGAQVSGDALIYGLADEVAKIYHAHNKPGKECTHTQVIFCDRRNSMLSKVHVSLSADRSGMPSLKEHLDDDLVVDAASADVFEEDEEEGKEVAPAPASTQQQAGDAFNLWEELREQLVARGIPREKVACITDARNKAEKVDLLDKMNSGELGVMIGSSDLLGIGSNFQKRLYAAHNFDPPRSMTPDAMEQRDGRILRQGNTHKKIRLIRYGMENTVIPAIYGRIQTKGAAAKQAFTKGVGVEFSETEDLRLEEMRAMLLTDKRAQERQMLLEQIRDMKLNEEASRRSAGNLRRDLDGANASIAYYQKQIADEESRAAWFSANVVAPSKAYTWTLKVALVKAVPTAGESAVFEKHGLKVAANGTVVMEGTPQKVTKFTQDLFECWKDEETFRSYGSLTLNGLTTHLRMTRVGDESRRIEAYMADPLKPADKDGQVNLYGSGLFLSADRYIDTVEALTTKATRSIEGHREDLRGWESTAAKAKAAIAAHVSPSTKDREALEAKLAELERDMRERPHAGNAAPSPRAKRCAMTFSAGSKARQQREGAEQKEGLELAFAAAAGVTAQAGGRKR